MFRLLTWKKVFWYTISTRYPYPLKKIQHILRVRARDLRHHREINNVKFIVKHLIAAMLLFTFLTHTFLIMNPLLWYVHIFLSFILMIKF